MQEGSAKKRKKKNTLPEGLAEKIFNSIPTPIYLINANTYDMIISKPFCHIHKPSDKNQCFSFFYDKSKPCYLEGEHCIIEEVKKTGKSQKKNCICYIEDKGQKFFEIQAHPVFCDNTIVSHVLLNYFDISEFKHYEELLSKSEETYRTLVQSIHGYLYSIRYSEMDAPLIYHSPQCKKITGYGPDEYGQDPDLWIKMVHPADVELVSGFFKDLMNSGKSKRIEHRIIHKNGQIIWVLNQCTVRTNEKGEAQRADGIILDITDRKKADQSLEASEKMYRNIISTTMEGYCHFNSNYEITNTNEAMRKMLGYNREQLTGKKISCLSHKDNEGDLMGKIARIEKEDQINFEADLRTITDASVATIISATSLKDLDNNFSGGFAFFTDISKRLEAEKSLILAKEKAEEATEIKDKFVSLVAHDLKGPLTSIWGYLQILHGEAHNDSSTKEFIGEAMSSCQDMTTLINEILSLSRLKTGQMTPKKTFFHAKTMVDRIIHNFSNHTHKKGITVINDIEESRTLYADEKLFFEVIRNLASNAIKFSSRGDSITFFIPHHEPSTIAISDTGTGMPPEYMKNIFKFEEKTSTKGTANESGTGLGLPLAKDIMLAHGGDLQVYSVPGKGSTFYAKLPQVTPKVLIVEDEEIVALSISRILSPLQIHVEIALNVPDAEELIWKEAPHLILLDIIMPEINGFQLLKDLMNNPETRNIPVIVITGDPNIETKDRAFKMGASDFIGKPFRREDILPRVRRFVL